MSNTFDAGSIESRLVLDRSDFITGLREAKTEGEDFAKQKYTAKLDADSAGVLASVAAARADLATLSDVNLNIGVTGSNARIRAISQSATALDGRTIGLGINLDGGAEVLTELRAIRQVANSLNGRVIRVTARFDGSAARTQMAAFSASTNNLTANVDRNRRGLFGWQTGMAGVKKALPGLIQLAILAAPALVPLTAAALNVTAVFTTMAVTVAAGAGIFALALKGAITNATNLNKTLTTAQQNLTTQRQALDALKPGTNAYANQLHKVELAQAAVTKANAAFTPSQRAFLSGLSGMKAAWQGFVKATQDDTLHVASVALSAIALAIPKLVPVVHAMAPEMAILAQAFHNWVTDGGLDRFVALVINVGVPAFHNLVLAGRHVADTFGSLFSAFAPQVAGMSQSIQNVTLKLSAWGRNGGFQQFIQYVQNNSKAVHDFFDALFRALGNVLTAMQNLGNPSLVVMTALLNLVAAMPPWLIQSIVVAFLAWRTAMLAYAIATGIAATATTIFETVSSPLFLLMAGAALTVLAVVAALAALAFGIYELVKHWGAVEKGLVVAWDATWDALKLAGITTWNAIKTAWEATTHAFIVAWDAVGTAVMWFWHNILQPTFNGIVLAGKIFVTALATLVFVPLLLMWKLFGPQIMVLWTGFFRPVFGWIVDGAKIWWMGVKLYVNTVITIIKGLGTVAMWLWTNAFKPVFGWIADGARIWWLGVQLYIHTVESLIQGLGKVAVWLWTNGFRPAFNWIGGGAKSLYSGGIKPAFDWSTGAIKALGSWATWLWTHGFKPAWSEIQKGTDALKTGMVKTFDGMKAAIEKTWNGIKGVVASPVNFVINSVYNHGIVDVWNKVAGAVGLKIKLGSVAPIKFDRGGAINGGIAGQDSVHILGMPGEHVWTAEEVKNAGGHTAMAAMRAMFASSGKARVAPNAGSVNSSHYAFGGGIIDTIGGAAKSVGGAISNTIGGAVSGLEHLARGALGAVVNPVLDNIGKLAVKGVNAAIPGSPPYESLMDGFVKAPLKWIKDFVANDDKKNSAAGGHWTGGAIPSAQHKAVIDAALAAAHVPPPGTMSQWETGLNTLIGRESGWNPNSINKTDINAKNGDPSRGLAQTIMATFSHFVPSSLRGRGIYDPVANVAAAIRYIVSRYGNITSVQQANASLPPKGYAVGGVTVPGLHMFGEKGPELVATSGGDRVFTAQDTAAMLRAYSGGSAPIVIKFPDRIVVQVGEHEFTAMLDDETRKTIEDVFKEAKGSR